MSDYKELVKALRICSSELNCGDCPLLYRDSCSSDELMAEAAAAIEDLTGFLAESERDRDEYEDRMRKEQKRVIELQAKLPKRGEWIVKGANRVDCSACGHSVCFAFGLSEGSLDLYKYCPECGAKMEVQA